MTKSPDKPSRRAKGGTDAAVRRRSAGRRALGARSSGSGVELLFARIVAILDDARARVVRAVNSETVLAYFHIGRELVEHVQQGVARAGYGRQLIEELSRRLTERLGRGFSTTNLRYFRTFYLAYADRAPEIRHIGSGEFTGRAKPRDHRGVSHRIRHTRGGASSDLAALVSTGTPLHGFSPMLGWAHYRLLMNVEHEGARRFYEIEAERAGWSVPQAVARYSVLHGNEQLFAAKYVTCLPSVKQLEQELARERRLVEERSKGRPGGRKRRRSRGGKT